MNYGQQNFSRKVEWCTQRERERGGGGRRHCQLRPTSISPRHHSRPKSQRCSPVAEAACSCQSSLKRPTLLIRKVNNEEGRWETWTSEQADPPLPFTFRPVPPQPQSQTHHSHSGKRLNPSPILKKEEEANKSRGGWWGGGNKKWCVQSVWITPLSPSPILHCPGRSRQNSHGRCLFR